MSSVIVSSHGRRFKLLNQNPDHIDEDDDVDLVEIYAHMYANCPTTKQVRAVIRKFLKCLEGGVGVFFQL